MSVPEHQRDAHEATDAVLNHIDGLIAALDVIEEHIRFPDVQAPAAKAFFMLRPMLAEKMAELWKLRTAEWKAIRESRPEGDAPKVEGART
ncbi:hypothetical protein HUK65_06310 [Rhodobacteraceae bacterium 2376]|uniref:Uncharacterized protein n=1 Tax=Rhabdonatronobacter sediminivivens TaxID=2743469 RepID=A0A7Z0HYH1_9RHOB|nr:hypothetical protein [Rhabdonatronobacter sediminivivens]NYS24600.1 hypothetical protein [Rhabdonatronobacter sediminivivens]